MTGVGEKVNATCSSMGLAPSFCEKKTMHTKAYDWSMPAVCREGSGGGESDGMRGERRDG